MKKVLRIQVSLPQTKGSMFEAGLTMSFILKGITAATDIDGTEYDFKQMQKFVYDQRGKAATYEFDLTICNELLTEQEMQEIINSFPATHKVIPNVAPPATVVVTDELKQEAEAFFKRVQEHTPAIAGSINDKLIIKGSYRAKKSNSWEYDFIKRRFNYNNAGAPVSAAFDEALQNLT